MFETRDASRSGILYNCAGDSALTGRLTCRKELQHMLFTRRKAEIEVLCAAASATRSTPTCAEERNDDSDEDEDGMVPGRRENTLVRYLVAKIGKAVDSCGART